MTMKDVECQLDPGDTTWVLVSTILVLGMMPALAFFEAGLLRSKNTASIIAQIIGGIVMLTVLWQAIGYTLVFGTSQHGIIGSMEHAFLMDVPYDSCSPHAPNIPAACYAIFMMMFAAITPLLMTGAFAERVKWKAFVALTISWEVIVFYPLAHWVWGDGWLANIGVLDFAGGIVIHTSAGCSSLVAALILGNRADFDNHHGEVPPSNLPLAGLGAALLWMGWFGFNAGSALAAGSIAVSAVVSTQVAGAWCAVTWLILCWWKDKPTAVGLINGVVAGLAGITPASGYISTQWSIGLGVVLGFASFFSVVLIKHKLHIDDALDVSSVHGLTGILGSLAIGLCAQEYINPVDGVNGAFYGNPKMLAIQLLGVGVAAGWGMVWTFILMKLIDITIGLKVDAEEELYGIDHVEHGEQAYNFDAPINSSTSPYSPLINH